MPQVQLDDKIFDAARRRATDAGYASVDEYITDVVVHDLTGDVGTETLDANHVFTPERLAELERISASVKAGGKTFTIADAQQHFANRRKTWLANHAS